MNAQQLKNSILQLAVQGKLVPQDPNDEPASALIERIRAEKERLIKEKKIKPDKNPSYIFRGSDNLPYEKVGKNEPVCIADEVTFDIPDSWEWVRLGNVCNIARGGSPRPIQNYLTKDDDGINWIKIGDSDIGGKYISKTKEKIKKEGITKSRMVHKGDFLLTNSMSFGRPYILNTDGCIHDGWLVLSDYQKAYNIDFLYFMLSSRFAFCQFCSVVSGAVVKNLNSDKVANAIFPLPPLIEQQRIVEKLKKLEPYINDYDKAYEKIEKLNTDFPDLLKKSILQEAVQGKLVPQDPTDEPASILIEKIRQEKEQLIKDKKIKKDKNESYIFRRDNSHYEKIGTEERCIDDEIPFDIPDSWEWTRLKSICIVNPRNQAEDDIDAGFIPMTLINDGYTGGHMYETKKWKQIKSGFTHFATGDLVLAKITPCFQNRKSTIISELPNNIGAGTTELHVIRNYPNSKLNLKYLLLLVKTADFISAGVKAFTGTAGQQRVGKTFVEEYLVPLPPLNEQQRIVDKVNQLLPQISKL